MKLIITGATGFVGGEVVRLALRNNLITSVVAIARREIVIPKHLSSEADTSKLKCVVLENWTQQYPEHVLELIKGADACIWTLAVTPTKSKEMDFEEVTRVCHDYTVIGLSNTASVANNPFRFIYTSGVTVERDQSKKLPFLQEYRLMRGRVENDLLKFAEENAPAVSVAIVKPGGIEGPGHPKMENLTSIWAQFDPTPWIHVSELAAAMIDQALNGVSQDTLFGSEIQMIGSKALATEAYTSLNK